MKSRNTILVASLLLATLFLSSCADVQHHLQPCMEGHTYGFWGGLWHGIIAPISFFCSLISDNIAMYATNNNGGWYNFGFILGIGGLVGGGCSCSK